MALEAGTQVGPYRLTGQLGRGGMASVYSAYEEALDRNVALKVLPAEFLHDPSFAERFNREARVIARLEHPGIVPIYAYGIDEARRLPWMAMRLVSGGSLASLLQRGRLPPERALQILRGIAEALDYAHGKGVVHRDVKPHNILLDDAGRAYLADFGIAKMLEAGGGLTQTGMITGTPQYMAPEQATATAVDRRADIYAVGIVAYEMFTGHVPFKADTPVAVLMKQVSEPLPRPAPSEVPAAVVEPIVTATAKRPEERWPTTLAFVNALERGVAQGTPPAAAIPREPPTVVSSTTAGPRAGGVTAVSARTAAAGTPPPGTFAERAAPSPPTVAAGPAAPGAVPRRGVSMGVVLGLGAAALALLLAMGGVLFGLWLLGGDGDAPAEDDAASPAPHTAQATASPPDSAPAVSVPAPPTAAPTPFDAHTPLPLPSPPPPPTTRATPAPPPLTTPPRPEPTAPPRETRPADTPPPAPAGPSAETRELLTLLRSGGRDERRRAAEDLGRAQRDAAHVVPALAAALGDTSEDVRLRAAEALGRFGAAARPALDGLVAALDGPDMVATESAKTLGKTGAAGAARPLSAALGRSDVYLRREAARALGKLGSAAADAVDALAEALARDKDKTVRQLAADALGAVGPPAARAVPALRQAASDKDGLLARKARAALTNITGEP